MNGNEFAATLNGFEAVTTDELMQVEGGFLGISWQDVKDAAKFVVGAIVAAGDHQEGLTPPRLSGAGGVRPAALPQAGESQ